MRKAGNRVRIAVQLVKVADGYHLWSETYDRDARRHLRRAGRHRAVGGEGAAHDAARATGRTRGERRRRRPRWRGGRRARRTTPRRTGSTCRDGSSVDRRRRRPTPTGRSSYLRQALALDPGFALAWAGLSRAYQVAGGLRLGAGRRGLRARPRRRAARAGAGARPGRGARRARPGAARPRLGLGRGRRVVPARAGARARQRRRAVRAAGGSRAMLGRLDEAVALDAARRSRRIRCRRDAYAASRMILPRWPGASRGRGGLRRSRSRLDRSAVADPRVSSVIPRRAGARSRRRSPRPTASRPTSPADLALAAAPSGAWAHGGVGCRRSHALIERYSAGTPPTRSPRSTRSAATSDKAFEWLDRAYAQRDPGVTYAAKDEFFSVLHGDPRWQAHLQRMGLA